MKQHYFVAYADRQDNYCEWQIVHCDQRMLQGFMDHTIRHSGIVAKGKAYKISRLTGKPTFTTCVLEAGLPFA